MMFSCARRPLAPPDLYVPQRCYPQLEAKCEAAWCHFGPSALLLCTHWGVGAGWCVGGRSTVLGALPALRWGLERAGLGSGTSE
ncbi:hypothetical protein HPB47_006731 [Ixodes persulcatus]|uniref:Uncharacterized protein n=1 Tax=Ixodes persulcatus TaxID=34615 RepID=A0AC60P9Z7_IXOPE|nr:hypothetical protein HPB47_006731 [Ixodes persulcatus]